MKRRLIARCLTGMAVLMMALSSHADSNSTQNATMASDVDRTAVQALEANVALVLARDGFEAYAKLFHPDYSNWSGNGTPLTREAFLSAVKAWYEGGGKAIAVAMHPVAIEVWGDLALSRYLLREDFADGSSFVGRFASVARKTDGKWQLYRTTFNTLYRGDSKSAPDMAMLVK